MLTSTKPCEVCGKEFIESRMGQKVCGWKCAEKVPKIARKAVKVAKQVERAADKVRAEKIKSRGEWLKECQTAVNKVARLRDIHAGHGCISCGATYRGGFGGAFDGGHFRSTGSAPHMRFYLPQILLQCVKCNRWLGGNVSEMRKGLIVRHGVDWVERIEAMQGDGRWSIEYLTRFKRVMTKKANRIAKRIELM